MRRKSDKPCKEREPTEPLPAPAPPRSPAPSTSEPSIERTRAPLVADAVISVPHWGRLRGGELLASSSRLDWALRLKRSHGLDALVCPKCNATLRPIATITDTEVVRALLVHLGLHAEPLPRARARDPTGQESSDFDAA